MPSKVVQLSPALAKLTSGRPLAPLILVTKASWKTCDC